MLHEFLTWWAEQLLTLVPARWRAGLSGPAAPPFCVRVTDPFTTIPQDVMLEARGQRKARTRYPLDADGVRRLRAAVPPGQAIALSIPPDMVLEQAIILPLATEREPARVLAYEMDRLTPFAADEIFWTWAVERRDRAAGRVHYRLSLVPKAFLAPLLDLLAGAGIRPAAIEVMAGGAVRMLALEQPRSTMWRRRRVPIAAAACAVLAVAIAAMPFVALSVQADRIDTQIAALRPGVDRAEALRRTLTSRAASSDAVQVQRARVGDALDVLATITAALPDDTFLNELSLRSRVVTISGQSGAAARLIGDLAAEPSLRNPAFIAPVMRSETGGGEGFAIRVEVAH